MYGCMHAFMNVWLKSLKNSLHIARVKMHESGFLYE